MFFSKMIESLRADSSYENALQQLITPFSPYLIADYYIGTEESLVPISARGKKICSFIDLQMIQDYDILYVQVDYFAWFCRMLEFISAKFILITGQFHYPSLLRGPNTDEVLENPKILLWFAQNPIYPMSDKYNAFPYGMYYENIPAYVQQLLAPSTTKSKGLVHLPLNKTTNKCRESFPDLETVSPSEFYEKLSQAEFVISPIGDRDDCFRHYEAIGLGAMPLSNVGELYRNIFSSNMIYLPIEELISLARGEANIDAIYREPNKNMICLEYHQMHIRELIDKKRTQKI